jgi:predicted AlkP superfamily phosphohydrolase/phosphomutase
MPCTFPPEEINGRMLSGVGVPDLRGGLGTSTFYTTQDNLHAGNSEKYVKVFLQDDEIKTYLVGPFHPKAQKDLTVDVIIRIDRQEKCAFLQIPGESQVHKLPLQKWSAWLKVHFKSGLLQAIPGMIRFNLRQIEPEFECFASPVNFDPQNPLFPISSPAGYAAEIENRLGSFYTLGMAEEHDGLIYGRIDENAFWEQCSLVLKERRKLMLAELNRFKEGFFFCLFDTPDRLQHMFWRFRENEHPDEANSNERDWKYAIEEHYRQLDTIIGEALKSVDDQTLLIVLSDHGMNSFKRGLNLNTWLYENGYLCFKKGIQPGEETGEFFQNVDWNRTQAYAIGLGGIYFNMQGREANGILRQSEIGFIEKQILSTLTNLKDDRNGQLAVRSVSPKQDIYQGEYKEEAPDLLVNFSPGYRVSWSTPLGGTPACLFEDNQKRWGGDHVIDPGLIPGVIFVNRPMTTGQPSLVDLAPTILDAIGVPKPEVMEGKNILA